MTDETVEVFKSEDMTLPIQSLLEEIMSYISFND